MRGLVRLAALAVLVAGSVGCSLFTPRNGRDGSAAPGQVSRSPQGTGRPGPEQTASEIPPGGPGPSPFDALVSTPGRPADDRVHADGWFQVGGGAYWSSR